MTYDWVARLLHWLMAALLIYMFFLGLQMEDLRSPERQEVLTTHSGIGLMLLALALFRLGWRRRHSAPTYPDSMTAREKRWARIAVRGFYVLMIALPVAGLLHAATYVDFQVRAFGLWNVTALLPSDVDLTGIFHIIHGLCAWLLALLLCLHVGATMKHAFWDRDGIAARMIPFLKTPK